MINLHITEGASDFGRSPSYFSSDLSSDSTTFPYLKGPFNMSTPTVREREPEDDLVGRSPKRTKMEEPEDASMVETEPASAADEIMKDPEPEPEPDGEEENILPPSHVLLSAPRHAGSKPGTGLQIRETDVGISEYVGRDIPPIYGIIKQRYVFSVWYISINNLFLMTSFTDFLVNEVDLDGNVIHLKSLEMPSSTKQSKSAINQSEADVLVAPAEGSVEATSTDTVLVDDNFTTITQEADTLATKITTEPHTNQDEDSAVKPEVKSAGDDNEIKTPTTTNEKTQADTKQTEDSNEPWPERFTTALKPFLSDDTIEKLKSLYLEGPEPPFVSDAGWAGRKSGDTEDTTEDASAEVAEPEEPSSSRGGRGRGRGGRGGRGARGGRGGKGGRPERRPDNRKVLSDVRVLSCFILQFNDPFFLLLVAIMVR
jgi:tRNA pseudouridine13 synthase